MERYHMLKLGFAILFYAAYCIRPMMVNGLEAEDFAQNHKNNTKYKSNPHDFLIYYQGVEGRPGEDFPVYSYIPKTTFSCSDLDSGYYADLDTDCQVFHICEEGKKISFLCPNGTIFQQADLICEWWFKVNCSDSPSLYSSSSEHLRNDVNRRKASRKVNLNGNEIKHGAIMRTEEAQSVSALRNGKKIDLGNQQSNFLDVQESNNRHLANSQRNFNTINNNGKQNYQSNNRNSLRDYHVQFSSTSTESTTPNYQNYNTNSIGTTQKTFSSTLNNRSYDNSKNNRGKIKYSNFESSTNFGNRIRSTPSSPSTTERYSTYNNYNFNNYNQKTTRRNDIYNNNFESTTKTSPIYYSSTTTEPSTTTSNARFNFKVYSQRTQNNNNNHNFNNNNFETTTKSSTIYYSTTTQPSTTTQSSNARFNFKVVSHSTDNNNNNNNNFNSLPDFPKHKSEINTKEDSTDNYEAQITQESHSFVKSPFNTLTDFSKNYKNHKPTYSDIKTTPNYNNNNNVHGSTSNKFGTISSITPQYVTTQPINNGKPFIGSRVGDKMNLKSTDNTIIFGVMRYSSTPSSNTEYGPLATQSTINNPLPTEKFNLGQNYTLPPPSTTQRIVNARLPLLHEVPKEGSLNFGITETTDQIGPINSVTPTLFKQYTSFGVPEQFGGSTTESTVRTNTLVDKNLSTKFNLGQTNPLPPHRTVIEKLKARPPVLLEVPREGTLNVGQVSTTTGKEDPVNSVTPALFEKYSKVSGTYKVPFDESSTSGTTVDQNFGQKITTELPKYRITAPPTGSLNLGSTESNIYVKPAIVKAIEVTTPKFEINVPDEQPVPVVEPEVTKKFVNLLYSGSTAETPKDFISSRGSTVYGTASSTTLAPRAKTTVQVDKSISSTPRTFQNFVPIKFDKNSDRVQIQLSKFLGGPTQGTQKVNNRNNLHAGKSLNGGTDTGTIITNGNDYVRLSASGQNSIKPTQQGTVVTKLLSSTTSPYLQNPQTLRPRGFQKSIDFTVANSFNDIKPTYPTYKISSAKPFEVPTTLPSLLPPKVPSQYDNVDSMINMLKEIANINDHDYSFESPRPGLVVPPSVGPQTLHTLAQYFANALEENEETISGDTKEKISTLLTQMTIHGYNTLFRNRSTSFSTVATPSVEATTISVGSRVNNDEIAFENDVTANPELRDLAKNFSLALSSYLNDPDMFKKTLEDLRPTEPPATPDLTENNADNEEILNYSDADIKQPSFPPVFPTVPTGGLPAPAPTWGFIISNNEVNRNSLNPDLSTADSQSFIPRYNNINVKDEKTTALPPNHWTKSPDATKLWHQSLSVNPEDVNEHFVTSTEPIVAADADYVSSVDNLPTIKEPLSEINYELRSLPRVALNSTQVHGILIDFMNSTKQNDNNRLSRILKKLNTSEEEFLTKMKEIESNPITKRLVLLLISECGANITNNSPENFESLKLSPSIRTFSFNPQEVSENSKIENSSIPKLVDPNLKEDDQDTRALQLLNSLYSIASKFGKRK